MDFPMNLSGSTYTTCRIQNSFRQQFVKSYRFSDNCPGIPARMFVVDGDDDGGDKNRFTMDSLSVGLGFSSVGRDNVSTLCLRRCCADVGIDSIGKRDRCCQSEVRTDLMIVTSKSSA